MKRFLAGMALAAVLCVPAMAGHTDLPGTPSTQGNTDLPGVTLLIDVLLFIL